MSLNICKDCNFEKKKCQCVVAVEPPKVKMTWWRKIIYYLIG
jgi:hypothetical protein